MPRRGQSKPVNPDISGTRCPERQRPLQACVYVQDRSYVDAFGYMLGDFAVDLTTCDLRMSFGEVSFLGGLGIFFLGILLGLLPILELYFFSLRRARHLSGCLIRRARRARPSPAAPASPAALTTPIAPAAPATRPPRPLSLRAKRRTFDRKMRAKSRTSGH